jgi:predicted nucleic acid-binding protein
VDRPPKRAALRTDTDQVRAFVRENFSAVLCPNEPIARRAEDLIAQHAAAHGLRLADALIAASVLEAGSTLATGNERHDRSIRSLRIRTFRER